MHPKENLEVSPVSGEHEHIICILYLLIHNVLRSFKSVLRMWLRMYLGSQGSSEQTLEDVNHIPEIHIRPLCLVRSSLRRRIQILQSSNRPATISPSHDKSYLPSNLYKPLEESN